MFGLQGRDTESQDLTVMEQYAALVQAYTQRTLAYETDIEDAFSGIERNLKQNLGGRICSALPEAVFDSPLLSKPCKGHDIQRRLPHIQPVQGTDISNNFSFPSWSWIGWLGPVEYIYSNISSEIAWSYQSNDLSWTKLISFRYCEPRIRG